MSIVVARGAVYDRYEGEEFRMTTADETEGTLRVYTAGNWIPVALYAKGSWNWAKHVNLNEGPRGNG
jgi:hypothetical protein